MFRFAAFICVEVESWGCLKPCDDGARPSKGPDHFSHLLAMPLSEFCPSRSVTTHSNCGQGLGTSAVNSCTTPGEVWKGTLHANSGQISKQTDFYSDCLKCTLWSAFLAEDAEGLVGGQVGHPAVIVIPEPWNACGISLRGFSISKLCSEELLGITEDVRKQVGRPVFSSDMPEALGRQATRIAEEGSFRVLILDLHQADSAVAT